MRKRPREYQRGEKEEEPIKESEKINRAQIGSKYDHGKQGRGTFEKIKVVNKVKCF